MPSRQGSATKAQALSQMQVEAGREKPLSSPTSQPAAADPKGFPSQAPARQPLWAHHLPTAFCLGVLLCLDKLPSPSVQQCSYTPQGSCCVMKTKQCTLREKSWGGGAGVSGSKHSTQKSLSELRPKEGPLAAQAHVIRTMTSSTGGLRTPPPDSPAQR